MLGLVGLAATQLVAMRVELEGIRASGSETLVELSLQIAPEDRTRVGRRVSFNAVLTRGDTNVASVARIVELDDRGRARIQVSWPAGTHQLRVDISSSTGANEGIWMGEVEIPRFEPEPAPTPQEPPAVAPEPAPVPETMAAAAAVTEEPAPTAAPEAAPPPQREAVETEVAAEPAPAVAPERDQRTAAAGWQGADPELAVLTAMVTDRSRPVPVLESPQFRLRVNGRDTEIDAVGASEVPLFLGFAVDVSETMAPYLPELSRQLSRLALRTVGDVGQLSLVTADAEAELVLDWGATASELAQTLNKSGVREEGNLAGLVATSLAAFEGRSGRRFLILVTDGGHREPQSSWNEAAAAVEAAGVPLVVIGFRGDWLRERTRRQLERFAAASGGRNYFLPDTGMLQMTLEYITDLINGSYAIRFSNPGRGSDLSRIRLETTDRSLDVAHPRTMR
jgi:hypothetical protein